MSAGLIMLRTAKVFTSLNTANSWSKEIRTDSDIKSPAKLSSRSFSAIVLRAFVHLQQIHNNSQQIDSKSNKCLGSLCFLKPRRSTKIMLVQSVLVLRKISSAWLKCGLSWRAITESLQDKTERLNSSRERRRSGLAVALGRVRCHATVIVTRRKHAITAETWSADPSDRPAARRNSIRSCVVIRCKKATGQIP